MQKNYCSTCGTQLMEENGLCSKCDAKVEVNRYLEENEVEMKQLAVNEKRLPAISNQEGIKSKFFTSKGRLNRKVYFLRVIVLTVFGLIFSLLASVLDTVAAIFVFIVTVVPFLISSVMLQIRRCHDLNKSGWFILLFYIPIVGIIVGLYVLFAAGTKGDNTYGADPLNQEI
ncbi:Uncharacterized membrane protein YhaH, DUF805 family [Propionispira arboris]|uniref:Uncharacterized membrane protein YhaH, DUF805 family n=1 Tax=Propionispira arboris TaxID=84035 RepID=A0A1H6ZM55_9FIRM|nr:DUF805 domain-containing protein [Propionispira arboris]SEJ54481.1 Uncharacterized membrane protein YhaH, DUF805 family [Propionispira arboris]